MMMHYRFIPTLENTHTSNSIYIDLMFTGNRPELERSADKLFDGFQDVPYGLFLNDEKTPGECLCFLDGGNAKPSLANCFSSEYIRRASEIDVDHGENMEDMVESTSKYYSLAIKTMLDNARIYGKLQVSNETIKRATVMTWPTEQRTSVSIQKVIITVISIY